MDPKTDLIFRPHRGLLVDSLEAAIRVPDGTMETLKVMRPETDTVTLYDPKPDRRVGWDQTFVVKNSEGHVIGMTNKMPRENAMAVQHGGNHYKGLAIQPFELSLANSYDSAIHSTIKYLSRHGDKGGKEDLLKGSHICQIRLAMMQKGYKIPRAYEIIAISDYTSLNGIALEEARIITELDQWARQLFGLPDIAVCNHLTQRIDALVELRYPEEDH